MWGGLDVVGEKPFLAHWRDALRDSALGEKVKLAGFVISTYADSRGHSFPSKQSIARGMSVKSTRTADTAVAALERSGFVSVTRTSGRRSNRYLLTIPTPQGVAGFEQFNHAARNAQPRKNGRSTLQPAAHESGTTKAKSESGISKVGDRVFNGELFGLGSDGVLYHLNAKGGLDVGRPAGDLTF